MTFPVDDPTQSIALAVQAATRAAAARRPPQEVVQLHYDLVENLAHTFGWEMEHDEVYALIILYSNLAKPTLEADLRAKAADRGWFDVDTLAAMTTSLGVNVTRALAARARGQA